MIIIFIVNANILRLTVPIKFLVIRLKESCNPAVHPSTSSGWTG